MLQRAKLGGQAGLCGVAGFIGDALGLVAVLGENLKRDVEGNIESLHSTLKCGFKPTATKNERSTKI